MHTFWFEYNKLGAWIVIRALTEKRAWQMLQKHALAEWDDEEDVSTVKKTKTIFVLKKVTSPEQSGVIAEVFDGEIVLK